MAVVLMNILIKQSYICVTERTGVAMAKGYIIPTEIQNSAPNLPGEPTMNIQMALNSPPRTLTGIKGKVVKVSTPTTEEVEQSPVPFQDIYLKDKSATVCVSLWNNMVDTLDVGQMVQMTKCRVRLFNGEKKLTTTRASTCQVVSDDKELKDVSSDEDSDSIEDPLEKNCEEGSITAVFDMDTYLACPSKGCNNTKLITIEANGHYIMQLKIAKANLAAQLLTLT